MRNRQLQTGIITLFFIATIFSAQAQNNNFDKVLTQEGEANLSVRQIIQDGTGLLWLATFSGLHRYEGDDFIFPHSFINNEELNADVTTLLNDKNNNIWIGTNQGLSKYDLVTDKLINFLPGKKDSTAIGSDKIRSLGLTKDGRIWIGTSDAGLYVYDPEQDAFSDVDFSKFDIPPPVYIKTIFIDSKGVIWIGTLGNGLYCFSRNGAVVDSVCHFQNNDPEHNLSNNNVYCIFEDIDGTLVVGTRDGLNIKGKNERSFDVINLPNRENDNMSNYFRSVIRDKNGKLWIGTWDGLILSNSFYDLENDNYDWIKHNRNTPHSISHNQILSIFEDKSGIVWVGTENGLNRFDPYVNQFKQLGGEVISSLKEQTATTFETYKGGVLILTLSDGLLFKKGDKTEKIFDDILKPFHNRKLYSILLDSDENIWLGSYNGLLIKINTQDKEVTSFKHSKRNISIYSIVEYGPGVLLIGTAGEGLKYFNTKTNTFTMENSLSGDANINDIHIDHERNLWIATQLGIFKNISGSYSFEYYLPDNPDSIANPNIFNDICESEEGEIYVGGRNGLYVYDCESNSFSEMKFDLPIRFWVTNLQFDSEQKLWLNINSNRIAVWEKETENLRLFKLNNGVRSIAHNRRGFYIDENDNLYVSGFDQIYQFNISKPLTNTYSPVPVFTKFSVSNTEVHAGMELNKQKILPQNIKFQKNIQLNHKNKDFTISFTSSSYLGSKDNKYMYILHGYDKSWHIGNEKFAHYTNLNPGKYTFELFGANNDGYWSENPAKLFIKITPSPFLSFWAILMYVLIISVLGWQIWRIVMARVQLKRELLIERVKRDKEEKFNQERLRFYTNISHELRTPLTLIMGPVRQLINSEKNGGANSRLYRLISDNSQRLLSLVNQLLDFRKSLHEGMKLKATYSNLVETIESNLDAFSFLAKEKSVYVDFSPESNVVKGWFDKEKLDIILFNILSNAFKFTPENGFVHVQLKKADPAPEFSKPHVEIMVSNSGKGIPRHLQEKVFERFFQAGNDYNIINTGTGIGLSLVKTLVELHHGKISLESEPDKQTSFTIYLPYEREAYSDEEIFDFKRDANRRTKELVENLKLNNDETVFQKKKTELQKILLVEDNSELRDFLSEYLSVDYDVLTASNGMKGLEICETQNPDLVISDIMMEKMDGIQFCEKIKSMPEISHIPVILMTAMASVENKMTGYKVGVDDYITKPFEPELLKIRIKNILDKLEKTRKGFGSNIHVSATELTISKIDEDFLGKVIDLLERNLDNADFDIESFSKNIGVSSSQLYRKIKSITGHSPNEFIRIYRLKKAAVLIKDSNLNISEIAYKVGFNDALYFSKCFKKQFGTAPSMYFVN